MRHFIVLFVVFAVCFAVVKAAKEQPLDASIVEFGADPSGTNDSTNAIRLAVTRARSNKTNVYIPKGLYKYNSVITITGVHFYGDGDQDSILYSTNSVYRALQLEGSGSGLRKLKVTGFSRARQDDGWNNAVFVNKATNFLIQNITLMPTDDYYFNGTKVNGIGGIINYHAKNGTVEYSTVAWTWADGIHTTGVSYNITVRYNTVHHVGDDSIAVVSYVPNEVANVEIYGNTIYTNAWARGISVVGGSRVRVYENTLSNLVAAAFWVASERTDFTTTVPHDVIFARNTVVNATYAGKDCVGQVLGLPASGLSNINAGQGIMDRILFVDNTIDGSCTNQIRTEGGNMSEIVYAGNKFTNGRQSTVELKAPTAMVYSIDNLYDGGNVNSFYAISNRMGLYSLNDSLANVKGASVRGYWLRDTNCVFNYLQIQNAQIAPSNTASFRPFIGIFNATSSQYISNVPGGSGNNIPGVNKGPTPPTAQDFVLSMPRPASGVFTISSSTFFQRASTNYRLLAVYGGVNGKVDISFEHDMAWFTITDDSKSSYSFKYAVATETSGAAVAWCTINIVAGSTTSASVSSSSSSQATTQASSTVSGTSASPSSSTSASTTLSPSSSSATSTSPSSSTATSGSASSSSASGSSSASSAAPATTNSPTSTTGANDNGVGRLSVYSGALVVVIALFL